MIEGITKGYLFYVGQSNNTLLESGNWAKTMRKGKSCCLSMRGNVFWLKKKKPCIRSEAMKSIVCSTKQNED